MEINQIARELLNSGKVKIVIGYAEGTLPGHAQTLIAHDSRQAEKFVFNKECVNNLTVYLKKAISESDGSPVAIFLKPCDARSVNVLMQEHQIKREDIYIIGLNCAGVESDGQPAAKCQFCTAHSPILFDELAKESVPESPPGSANRFAAVDEFEKLSPEERWQFWTDQFEKCLRCYACRQVCPLCYCEQCIVDKTQPRWIDSSAHKSGNLNWHLIRAFHLAGRCTGCGECERACHQDIPLGLLNKKMAKEVFEQFGYRPGTDAEAKPVLTDFRMEDNQDFIR